MSESVRFAAFLTILIFYWAKTSECYDHYRLPRSVRPCHYNLRILTHLEDAQYLFFSGDVEIHLRVLHTTNSITLHASPKLNILSNRTQLIYIDEDGNKQLISIKSAKRNPKHNYYTLLLETPIKAKKSYKLKLQFCSPLNRKLMGYYVSSYKNEKTNKTRYISVTQFEPADAHSAFPCFDEPELKATFNITLGHYKKMNALSNMPLREKVPMQGRESWLWSIFEQTVPMSTYLVAFSVNDFEGYTSVTEMGLTKNNVKFTTWARPSAISQCHYAAEVGPRLLGYYEKMFDIPFPLPKVDQVAIPDFNVGAMENWGLLTFRESALFYADDATSQSDMLRVANIIAHELAHQWFGNLVTMKWWNDLWLNEGFATYVATLGTRKLCRKWQTYEEEALDNVQAILNTDALFCTRPISQEVTELSQIGDLFDPITYRKGAVIIRMMHMFIGDAAFRNGLTCYLKQHAYGNADQNDLWQALTQAAYDSNTMSDQLSVSSVMNTWTLQAGYPLVIVKRDYPTNTAEITQQRFSLHGDAKLPDNLAEPFESTGDCWFIPLSYTYESDANFSAMHPREWLKCDDERLALPLSAVDMPEDDEWIIFNVQQATPYRVHYDECNWAMIIKTLNNPDYKRIHVMNRAQVVDDALALAWSGHMSYRPIMELFRYLKQETEFMPWRAALEQLSGIYRVVRQTCDLDVYQRYMLEVLQPIYIHLKGMRHVTHTDKAKRHAIHMPHKALICQWACRFEQLDCIRNAMEHFQRWYITPQPDGTNPVPKDLRSVVYCTAMRHGDEDDWNFLWDRYTNASVASEKHIILHALACTREPSLLKSYIKLIFHAKSPIRKQDATSTFSSLVRADVGYHHAKDYYMNNFDRLYKFYEPNVRDLAGLLIQIAQQMSTEEDYVALTTFIAQRKQQLKLVFRSLRRAMELAQLNLNWRNQRQPDLIGRMKAHYYI